MGLKDIFKEHPNQIVKGVDSMVEQCYRKKKIIILK